ncbi:MAG: hypothetical protein PHP46_02705, partial [Candidatus Omnitrophica bacterium]|nr:hypothetical protein [Candidatus Omnitrophota bacterium]
NPDLSYTEYSDFWSADIARYVREYNSSGQLLKTYEYDSNGNLISVTDSSAIYTYYASGRIHTKELLVDELPNLAGTIFEYDDTDVHGIYGHLMKQTNPDNSYKDFGEQGLLTYLSNIWERRSSFVAESFLIGDITGDGIGDIITDFGSYGLFKYDSTTALWSQLSTADPESMLLDGSDIITDFGSYGLFKYDSTTALWSQLSTADPESMLLDGSDIITD